jgi:hypothetical protein
MLTGIISIGFPVLLLRYPHVEMLLVSLEADDAPLLLQLLVEVVDGLEDEGLHRRVAHDLTLHGAIISIMFLL